MASKAYRADYDAARVAAYKFENNPFEEGTRRWRMCEKARRQKSIMDDLDDEMVAVYGPIGVKKVLIQNEPGSTRPALMRPEPAVASGVPRS